jgi:threonine/homoserine/homoserine lactone efflux protein
MLPLQILLNNLLYDFSQNGIPFDRVDADYLAKPRQWRLPQLRRFMLFVGPVSSLFDYVTFAVLWFVFGANTPERQSLFQTGWFVESLLTQTLIVHIIRTSRIPFLQSNPAPLMALITLVVMAIGNLRKRKAVVFPGASGKRPLVLASRGFMLNLLNPANYLSWLGLTATLNNVLHYTTQQQFAFYTGALAGIFGMEMLISLGATWLKRYISPLFLRRLDVAVGIVFLVFAVLLVKPLFSGK